MNRERTGNTKTITVSLRQDQIDFLVELNAVSLISKSAIVQQCLDKCAPDLMAALEAMKKHGIRPTTKAERKKAMKK